MATSATSSQGGGALTCYHVGRGIIYDASGLPVPIAAGNNVFDDIYSTRYHNKTGLGVPDFPQGLAASAGGAAITGNSSVTGDLTLVGAGSDIVVGGSATITTGPLTVSAGGAAITGNSTLAGDLTLTGATSDIVVGGAVTVTSGPLTVSAGGAAITGNSVVTGTLNVTSTTTSGAQLTVTSGGANITGNIVLLGGPGNSLTISSGNNLGLPDGSTLQFGGTTQTTRSGSFGTAASPTVVNTASAFSGTTASTTAFHGVIRLAVTGANILTTESFRIDIPNAAFATTNIVKVYIREQIGAEYMILEDAEVLGAGTASVTWYANGGTFPIGSTLMFAWEVENWS